MVQISRGNKRFSRLKVLTLAEAGILERRDLQEYIFNSREAFCEELGQELMFIGKEVPPSDIVGDRIDLLAIDRDGSTVIIELKRGNDKLQLFQAVSYAGMVANWSSEELSWRLGSLADGVREFVEADEINIRQRVILLAEAYDYSVLIGAEWLYEKHDVDIACVRVTVAKDQITNSEYLTFTQVFPAPELDEIAKSRRSRQRQAAKPYASWKDALASVTNEAARVFFDQQLSAGRSSNETYLDIHFSVGDKRRFTVKLKTDHARVTQQARFPGDIDFWRSRLSSPNTVRPGTKVGHVADILRFDLLSPEDFAAFEKAVASELQAVAWGESDSAQEAKA
jgi:hypothetical protein